MRARVAVLLMVGMAAGAAALEGPAGIAKTVHNVEVSRLHQAGFTRIIDILPTEEGLWVLTDDEAFLVFLPDGGKDPVVLGRRGRGPLELRDPLTLIPDPGGVKVVDPIDGKAVLAVDGETFKPSSWEFRHRSMVRRVLAVQSPQSPFKIRQHGAGLLLARFSTSVRFPGEQTSGELVSLNPRSGGVVGTGDDPDTRVPGAAFLAPMPLWDVCNQTVLTFDGESELTWSGSSEGQYVRSVEIPRARLSEEFVLRHFIALARAEAPGVDSVRAWEGAMKAMRQRPRLYPSRGPAVIDLACVDGLAFLNLFDGAAPPAGRGTKWILVPPSGPVEQFVLDAGFRPLRTRKSTVFGVVRDPSTDLEYIAAVNVPIGAPNP